MYSVQYAVCSVQLTVYSVHCNVGDNGKANSRQTSGNQQTVNTGFSTRILEKSGKVWINWQVSAFDAWPPKFHTATTAT